MRPYLAPLIQATATVCLITVGVAPANEQDNRLANSPPPTWQENSLGAGSSNRLEDSSASVRFETTETVAGCSTTNQECMSADFRGLGEPRQPVWGFEPATGGNRPFKVTSSGFAARLTSDGYILSVPGQAVPRGPGNPDLPVASILLRDMPDAVIGVELDTAKWTEIKDITIAPVERRVLEDVTTNAPSYCQVRTPEETVYGRDRFWPECIARLDEAWLGTNRIVRIEITLFQYNPVRGVLRYCPTLEGRIVIESQKGGATR